MKHCKNMIKNKKILVLLASFALLLSVVIGSTVAFLTTGTGAVTNTFLPAHTGINVEESFSDNVKTNVQVTNKGDVPAYVRAKPVIYWARLKSDNTTEILATPPASGSYTVEYPSDSVWKLGKDGFYYYPTAVASGATTSNLIDNVTWTDPGDGSTLIVDIFAETIQTTPAEAVCTAWASGVEAVNADGSLDIIE